MPEKKKHHYVPIFYLKLFSNNKDNKTIGIFNIESKKFIRNGALKSQAHEDYFYGKDKIVENALQVLETEASRVLTSLIENHELPLAGTDDFYTLFVYVVFQATRTLYSSDAINEHFDKMIKATYKEDPRVKNYLSLVKFEHSNPAAFALGTMSFSLPIVFDLEYKLLINKTSWKFITSDNPVIKYNQFMESRKWPGGHCGWAETGLQVFFPLSPDICLILYDKDMYKIGSKNRNTLSVCNVNDVKDINKLQFINANENIYFNDEVQDSYVKQIYQTNEKLRRNQKIIVDEFRQAESEASDKAFYLLSYDVDIKINLFLTFIEESKSAKRKQLGPTMMNVRNPQLCRELSELQRQIRSDYEDSK